jgi:hypothetical protein
MTEPRRYISDFWWFTLLGPPVGYFIYFLGEPLISPFPSYLSTRPILVLAQMMPFSYIVGGVPAAITGSLFAYWGRSGDGSWRRVLIAFLIGAAVTLAIFGPLAIISTPRRQAVPIASVSLMMFCGALSAALCAWARELTLQSRRASR